VAHGGSQGGRPTRVVNAQCREGKMKPFSELKSALVIELGGGFALLSCYDSCMCS